MRSDDRYINLRKVSRTGNNQNRSTQHNNTSGYTGVYYSNTEKRWKAFITINRTTIGLGTYISFDEAVLARQQANLKYGFINQ